MRCHFCFDNGFPEMKEKQKLNINIPGLGYFFFFFFIQHKQKLQKTVISINIIKSSMKG